MGRVINEEEMVGGSEWMSRENEQVSKLNMLT